MNKFLYIGIAALFLMGVGGFLIKQYGNSEHKRGKAECVAEQNAGVVVEGKKRNELEKELRALDDPELVARYCRWVRGISYSECVRTYRFIP